MKKLLALVLVLAMMVSLAACTYPDETKPATTPAQTQPQTQAQSQAQSQESQEPQTSNSGFEYKMIPFLADYDQYRYDGEFNVLYLVCTTLAEYFPNSYAVWQPMLEEAGIHMDLVGPPEYSDNSLIATMESSLASNTYDLILLYPITPQAITPLLEDIWNNYHVPVVAYAFDSPTGCGHYYMGTSYYQAGVVLGNSIVEYVNKNKAYFDTLSTIPFVVYKNSAAAEQYKRIQGAMDVLKADGRFTLIEEYEANNDAACMAQTETVLNLHPEVEVILTQIDNDVTGTHAAVNSGAFTCSEYLSVWGFDATGAVLNLMYTDGVEGCAQGSSFIDHCLAGQALAEFLPIAVGAAKQNVLIEFPKDQFDQMDTLLANYYLTVTPEIVDKYYTPKN